MNERFVEPEQLDHLPADHPEAVRSRRDLRIINAMLGTRRWLEKRIPVGAAVLELGAGDGSMCRGSSWTGLDLAPRPIDLPQACSWVQGDMFDASNWPKVGVIVANLFLHHFNEDQLQWLGQQIRRSCGLFLACEPRRHPLPMASGALLATLCDFSPVTWNDMMISIRAGFRGAELADALGFNSGFRVSETLLGSYRLEVHL
ncbi:MAG: hypothetical protein JNJ83_14135 [Verrucomicrobiaceae bacterium]|nr:hypothetical protein [Verrucomicrobiaceae bacterium]